MSIEFIMRTIIFTLNFVKIGISQDGRLTFSARTAEHFYGYYFKIYNTGFNSDEGLSIKFNLTNFARINFTPKFTTFFYLAISLDDIQKTRSG